VLHRRTEIIEDEEVAAAATKLEELRRIGLLLRDGVATPLG
jgi:hypothetical protein